MSTDPRGSPCTPLPKSSITSTGMQITTESSDTTTLGWSKIFIRASNTGFSGLLIHLTMDLWPSLRLLARIL